MNHNIIRQKYLDFFKSKGHAIISPASLIPQNDSSLLFTNSGMFPLVPYLLGEQTHPSGKRLTDSQPCFRTDDIEEVGDGRHNTFFEMLGNWSLGDYFKEEQLNWWFEFIIEELGLDINRIYQSVYAGDDSIAKDNESIQILKSIYQKYNIDAEEGAETIGKGDLGPGIQISFDERTRIFAYRDKNWWQRGDAVGELGGPDSETFYDTGKVHDPKFGQFCHLNCDCGRFIEIGNSVFMQFQKTENSWAELKQKNVDFGGGLERLTMILQNKSKAFETDLFMPIINRCEELSGEKYSSNPKSFEIIADHIRATTFLIADGAVPSNIQQGYFVRRLIRRAIRFGQILGLTDNFLPKLVDQVIEILSDAYPQLTTKELAIKDEVTKEETKFRNTLGKGLREFEKIVAHESISGHDAFILYSTYGFPIEMTEELAAEKGIEVDRKAFDEENQKHQDLSRTASAGMFKGGLADQSEATTKLHTAAHLLDAALRQILGEHVFQKGSNITAERLRFDFSHPEKMTDEEKQKVESIVNQTIADDLPIHFEEMTVDEAKKRGALGVFESKYGEKVKVYFIGESGQEISKEICGGPHVEQTKILGHFKITKEESSSQGVRRIKATLS
ncbi:MAG: Alanine-tRNA ligase [Berkelbacteria bacterium GW2011_GWA2_38_9]|uniref:Alanine--tRNA ligase n=1 Tax=Berkelbacteria bacterium GW2011_GWA2_38_9 TaxID=1618334 RepID=A0A0G0NWY2_9BACT|nr:MAG: Alanine-tRNA ligase [Berkelbacteria bacterium GW2011_GWA2_38_9]